MNEGAYSERVGRLEGIIEQVNARLSTIETRLSTIERVGVTLLSMLLAGVVGILVRIWGN